MSDAQKILIKNGNVVFGDTVSQQDVLVIGEQIAAIGKLDALKADMGIDAQGLLVLPGAIDPHVHFNDYFMNTVSVHNFYTGTLAAAFGGVTSIIDFANQAKGESLIKTLEKKKKEAQGQALIDWGVHPVITQPTDSTLTEIKKIVAAGAPTIKCYMTYRDEGLMIEHKDLLNILEQLKRAGGMLMLHAEDNDVIEKKVQQMLDAGKFKPIYHARSRPPEAEAKAIQRAINIARQTGGRLFIVHMASVEGVKLVGAAQAEGLDVFAETCTHYLVFTEKMLQRDDGIKWICSPPLRNQRTQDMLWSALRYGPISLVSSDDAAYSWEAKLYGAERFDKCPNGIPGIETRFYLLYSEGVTKGRISLSRFVKLVSTAPARLFGLSHQKGSLAPGLDADIVLFDPNKKWVINQDTLHMATDWTAYDNMEITGKIVKVFSRGEIIIDGDRCLARKGRGRYLHRRLKKAL
jgi:dihydropyrimidinase